MNEKHVPVSLRVFAVYTHVACAPVKQAAASRSAMASLCAFVSLCGSGGHHHLGGVRHPEVFFRSAFAPPGLLKVSNLSLILQFHVESCTRCGTCQMEQRHCVPGGRANTAANAGRAKQALCAPLIVCASKSKSVMLICS